MSTSVHQIEEAAAAWDTLLRSTHASAQDHAAFEAWLAQDSEHQIAYERLQAALRILRSNADLPELSALRDEARNTVNRSRRRRIVGGLSVGAAIAAMFALAVVKPAAVPTSDLLAELQGETVYTTSPTDQSPITLADGSVVTLDSGTRMAVRLSAQRRDVTLISGRALFKVAKDRTRPFVVKAGGRTITALGTVFDVRVSPKELRVTLAEGMVAVKPANAAAATPQQILKPSQQLVAVSGAPAPLLRTVDVDTALAWADRQFFFENEPLASAIDEMNRYAEIKMVVDPTVANLRINGMFRVSNQAGFIEALKITLPVDVHADTKGRLVVTAKLPGRRLAV